MVVSLNIILNGYALKKKKRKKAKRQWRAKEEPLFNVKKPMIQSFIRGVFDSAIVKNAYISLPPPFAHCS